MVKGGAPGKARTRTRCPHCCVFWEQMAAGTSHIKWYDCGDILGYFTFKRKFEINLVCHYCKNGCCHICLQIIELAAMTFFFGKAECNKARNPELQSKSPMGAAGARVPGTPSFVFPGT